MDKIDIVMTWVDGSDPGWVSSKAEWERKIKGIDTSGNGVTRYRDWDNLQYIFRGIEKFMPWVDQVHFVTCGHLPSWLNTDCPKLHVVRHEDFIPEKYLPTFNSNAIEMNQHRIEGLADHFINFNDDTFVIQACRPEDFFENGLPKDMFAISPSPVFRDIICCTQVNNLGIINDYFTPADIRKDRKKYYSSKYGKFRLRTFLFSRFGSIIGFFEPHTPIAFLKSSFVELWEKEYETLDKTSSNKFRTRDDINQWLVRHWQLMSGSFEPRRWDFGLYMRASDTEGISRIVKDPGKTHLVCINDSTTVEDFEKCRDEIRNALEGLLPDKSAFEK